MYERMYLAICDVCVYTHKYSCRFVCINITHFVTSVNSKSTATVKSLLHTFRIWQHRECECP